MSGSEEGRRLYIMEKEPAAQGGGYLRSHFSGLFEALKYIIYHLKYSSEI
jgi:hypothetical protein